MSLDEDIKRVQATRPATRVEQTTSLHDSSWFTAAVASTALFLTSLTPQATTQSHNVYQNNMRPPTQQTTEETKRTPYQQPSSNQAYADEHIPVLMYHKVGRPENRYTVSPQRLRHQLDALHDHGYYAVSLNDYATNDLDHVPRGKKPFVITFDDAHPSQFQRNDDGEPTKDSAVGILKEAFDDHDSFGHGATFYVSYAGDDHDFRHPFGGDETSKFDWLQRNDYTIGYHTPYHANNKDATPSDIDEQTTVLHALIDDATEEPAKKHYAHPFGATPRSQAVTDSLNKTYTTIVDAWGGLAPHPKNPGFNPHSIPRIETNAETFNSVLRKDTYTRGELQNY